MCVQLCGGAYICATTYTYKYTKMLYAVNSLPERTQVYSLALPSHNGIKRKLESVHGVHNSSNQPHRLISKQSLAINYMSSISPKRSEDLNSYCF